jgi:hypothetical protein
MHFAILVVTENKPSAQDQTPIDEVMQPYHDQHYDWYQVGGRWTGLLDGYDPEKDPANIKTCDLCGGTGSRPNGLEQFGAEWVKSTNGCNGCSGTGKRVEWPTQWKSRDGDTIPVTDLTEELYPAKFHGVCVEGYGWYEGEEFQPWQPAGKSFVPKDLPPLAWLKEQGEFATIVDCHN